MTANYEVIDTGGFMFWRNERVINRADIQRIGYAENSCSTCAIPVEVYLNSGEIVRGTIDGTSDYY
jgi:hypothetical protein